MSGVSAPNLIGRDVLGHHGTRGDNGAVSDMDALHDQRPRADSDVVSDHNGLQLRDVVVPMFVGEHQHVNADHALPADSHAGGNLAVDPDPGPVAQLQVIGEGDVPVNVDPFAAVLQHQRGAELPEFSGAEADSCPGEGQTLSNDAARILPILRFMAFYFFSVRAESPRPRSCFSFRR